MRGKFRRKPSGLFTVGIVMHDFDYSTPLSSFAAWLSTLGLTPLEQVVGTSLKFTMGDRAEVAKQPDAEVAHIVGDMAVFDQVIVTEAGEEPPPLCGPLENLGIARGKLGSSKWAETTKQIASTIDTEKTYTFCFWSCSRFVDVIGDALVNLIPFMPSLGLSYMVLGDWPAHFVVYELQGAQGSVTSAKHPEHKKKYFVDLMFWSAQLQINPAVMQRYKLSDAVRFIDRIPVNDKP